MMLRTLNRRMLPLLRPLSSDSILTVELKRLPAEFASPRLHTSVERHDWIAKGRPETRLHLELWFKPNTGQVIFTRGLSHDISPSRDLPATVAALKNPTNQITYDESCMDRHPQGDPSKRAFSYFILTIGRCMLAAGLRLFACKVILSMSASKDVLAMASLEMDVSSIAAGNTVTVKWRGKPVFVRNRTEADIKLANSVSLSELRDPETDEARATNPTYLIVVGVCTHLGCVPLPGAGDYGGWFCPCHGSHYDISGRIRKGPAPRNLEVPKYAWINDTRVVIG
ncbi:cytochrome b-c1 complex subunit Rieske-4, mitochondrial isoform X1 [Physcomitrium patens]|uniref:cytochrome b-c1 complex subunit Rieske-4, mitochondrial isoform X1 n=1 Tax=Physcomitrium patens TaxID=3218 RepID=UPI000D1523A9|nr:cytochrome b-c1 complex subunit Rieske-4, mitochondrial-like isoform X1 [Physcomitrium patens]|eukprot:XP_024390418.1 cytochrome b-c1 complex subunit Rieske-4, mitochondrial-like isoform X1 [Physcomitrella patens]